MTNPFNWRAMPSETAKALQPHKGNKKAGAPITLNGTNHGGAYSRAVPPLSQKQIDGADSMWGVPAVNLRKKWGDKVRGDVREALRTGKEMAAEFGISAHCLAGFISNHNGPKPRIANRTAGVTNRVQWYSPSEMRKWWKGIKK
jgi:hypothetical protein